MPIIFYLIRNESQVFALGELAKDSLWQYKKEADRSFLMKTIFHLP